MYFNLEIASTSSCNMACTYCFEGEELQSKKSQPIQNIDKIIDKIEIFLTDEKFNKEYPKGICINFWGGEPTLNFNWNKKLIEKTNNQNYKFRNKITYFIYSNGFDYKKLANHINLFTKEELLKDKLRIQISYDGISNGRVDHKNNVTDIKVLNHIKTFSIMYPELNLSTKPTIQPSELLILETIWNNYFELFLFINSKKSRTNVNFSPTLNYVDDFDDTSKDYLSKIETQFQKVLLLEKSFYMKYGFHLFGWFSKDLIDTRQKRLTNCSAGINILAIDYNDSLTTCHGALYSPLKYKFEQFHNMNLNQNKSTFIGNFFRSREELQKNTDYVSTGCINCEATTCYKCPIVNLEQNKNDFNPDNYQVRDTRHCSIYKLFGKYDRTLIKLKEGCDK